MTSIPQKELRNQVGEVLRRVEAGETLTFTVAGRPVAELGPIDRRRWVQGAQLARLWRGPTPVGLIEDLQHPPAAVEATFDPLPVTLEIAREWGRLAAAVAQRGAQPRRRQIDLAIAATANVYALPLLTHNVGDLRIVDDLVDVRSPDQLPPG